LDINVIHVASAFLKFLRHCSRNVLNKAVIEHVAIDFYCDRINGMIYVSKSEEGGQISISSTTINWPNFSQLYAIFVPKEEGQCLWR